MFNYDSVHHRYIDTRGTQGATLHQRDVVWQRVHVGLYYYILLSSNIYLVVKIDNVIKDISKIGHQNASSIAR